MDSGYCCTLAGKKLQLAIHGPARYLFNEVFQFCSLACSSNVVHILPTFIFIISISILIRNQKENFFYIFDHTFQLFFSERIKAFFRDYWLSAAIRQTALALLVLVSFCCWNLFQELVYCMVWFMTSESINPDLKYKWWFKAYETMKGGSSRVFIEVIPPGVVAWIIMIFASSICLVIAVNDFKKISNAPWSH